MPFVFDEDPAAARLLRETVRRARDLPLLRQRRPRAPARGQGPHLRRRQAARPDRRAGDPLSQDPARALRRVRAAAGRCSRSAGASRPSSSRRCRTSPPAARRPPGRWIGHRIGGFICYEAIFPSLVRRFAAGGAELLVNVTNDAWYGTTSAPAPAPGDGGVPSDREPPLPGAGRQYRDHRRRRPARPGARADARCSRPPCSCGKCPSSRRRPSTRATATCSRRRAGRPPWRCWRRRHAAE